MPELVSELSAPMYSFNAAGKIQLEKKENIKQRMGRSPDLADALALTFALPVVPEVGYRQLYAETSTSPAVFGNRYDEYDDAYDDFHRPRQRQRYADGAYQSLFSLWD